MEGKAYLIHTRERMHDDGLLGQDLQGLIVDDVLALGQVIVLWPILESLFLDAGLVEHVHF